MPALKGSLLGSDESKLKAIGNINDSDDLWALSKLAEELKTRHNQGEYEGVIDGKVSMLAHSVMCAANLTMDMLIVNGEEAKSETGFQASRYTRQAAHHAGCAAELEALISAQFVEGEAEEEFGFDEG